MVLIRVRLGLLGEHLRGHYAKSIHLMQRRAVVLVRPLVVRHFVKRGAVFRDADAIDLDLAQFLSRLHRNSLLLLLLTDHRILRQVVSLSLLIPIARLHD